MSLNTSDPEKEFKSGVLSFRAKEFKQAIIHFDRALQPNQPNHSSFKIKVLDSRAAAKENSNDIKGALLDAKKVIDLRPDLPRGYVRAARLFRKIGRMEASLQMYDRAIARYSVTAVSDSTVPLTQTLSDEREEVQRSRASKSTKDVLGGLPLELFVKVINHLDGQSRVRCMHVCSSWRSIIYNTPQFWTHLNVTPKPKRALQSIKFYVARLESSSYGLESVSIHYSQRLHHTDLSEIFELLMAPNIKWIKSLIFIEQRPTAARPIYLDMLNLLMKFLLAHSTTLRVIEINISQRVHWRGRLSEFLIMFPKLKRLRILTRGQDKMVVPYSYPSPGGNPEGTPDEPVEERRIPQIENLVLQGIFFSPVPPVRIESLRTLSLIGPLDMIELSVPQTTVPTSTPVDPAHLPHLEELDVIGSDARQNTAGYLAHQWQSCLGFPNLKRMSVSRSVEPLTQFLKHMDNKILSGPIAPGLRCLVLTDVESSTALNFLTKFGYEFTVMESLSLSSLGLTRQNEGDLIEIFNILPPLNHLCLNNTNASVRVVKAIKTDKLEHLSLLNCGQINFTTIVNLLGTSATDSVVKSKLSYLDITGCNLISTREMIDWLRARVSTVVWQESATKATYQKKLRLD